MKEFLRKKHVNPGFKIYGIDALGAMAYGLFATLLIGTILNLSLIHISEPTRREWLSRMPSSA